MYHKFTSLSAKLMKIYIAQKYIQPLKVYSIYITQTYKVFFFQYSQHNLLNLTSPAYKRRYKITNLLLQSPRRIQISWDLYSEKANYSLESLLWLYGRLCALKRILELNYGQELCSDVPVVAIKASHGILCEFKSFAQVHIQS